MSEETTGEFVVDDSISFDELEASSEREPLVIVQGEDGVFRKAESLDDDVVVSDAIKQYIDPEDAEHEPPIDPTSAEALAEYDAETVRLINEEAEEVARYEREYENAAEIAKDWKKDFEKAEKELRELIEERKKNRGKPKQPTLFKDPAEVPNEQNNAQESVDANSPAPEPQGSGVWQGNYEFTPADLATPLASLSISQGILNKLSDPTAKDGGSIRPITTVGEYFEYLKPLPNGFIPYLKNIKGLGDTAVEKLEQAILDFTEERCKARKAA